MPNQGVPLAVRFAWKIGEPDANGCWPWKGSLDPNGYGRIYTGKLTKNGTKRAEGCHRIAVILSGRTIPDGYVIDHLCRNPSCVNPDHLEVVTPRENYIRGIHPNVLLHHAGVCKNGHLKSEYERPYGVQGRRLCLRCNADRAAENRRKRNVGV